MMDELIKEKGNFPLAMLTLNEFMEVMEGMGIKKEAPEKKGADLISAEELTRILNISKSTLYRLRLNGEVPEYQVGKKVMFNLDEVKKALFKNVSPSFSSGV